MSFEHLKRNLFWVFLLFWARVVFAAGTTTAVSGKAEFVTPQGVATPLAIGQRIETGATLKTADRSSVTIRFDDGHSLSLSANTVYVVAEYRFTPQKPVEGSFVGNLVKGAMRSVTGLIGETNKEHVVQKTATATIGIRGTDYNVYYDGTLYLQVSEGAIFAKNEAGTQDFDAVRQPLGVVRSATTAPQPVSQSELPTAVTADFRVLSAVPITGRERKPSVSDPSCSDRR